MRRLVFAGMLAAVLGFCGVAAAQGLMPDPPDALERAAPADAFRGVLPPRADVSAAVPSPRRQSPSGTCTSWAVTYAAGSEALRRANAARPLVPLSPAFTYVLAGGAVTCLRPTNIIATLEVLRTVGALPLDEFAFDPYACTREPTPQERARAAQWRIKGWGKVDASDLAAVKGQLAAGRPVIFGMRVGPAFSAHRGDKTFATAETDAGVTGHAMVLVGYDDTRSAFRLQNSWGKTWGDGGYAWIDYATWQRSVRTGFVIN